MPLEQFFALGMLRVSHGFDQVFVTGDAAAVLRRTGAGAGQAGDGPVGDPREEFLDKDFILPTVAEVVLVDDPVVLGQGFGGQARMGF